MARKKELDKLTRENMQALAAGMSYGKWKALQPVAVKEEKPPEQYYNIHKCLICGLEFRAGNNGRRKYCSNECANVAENRARRERRRAK